MQRLTPYRVACAMHGVARYPMSRLIGGKRRGSSSRALQPGVGSACWIGSQKDAGQSIEGGSQAEAAAASRVHIASVNRRANARGLGRGRGTSGVCCSLRAADGRRPRAEPACIASCVP